jgi:hypothetical protein
MSDISDIQPVARDTGNNNFQRVHMTPTDNPESKHTAEEAIQEGRVRTDEENYKEKFKVEVTEKPQEEEAEETLLAGKYKSAEELEKAYRELQSKLGKGEAKEEEAPQEETKAETTPEISQELYFKGYEEWQQTGQLSKQTIQKFVDGGIPERYVQQFVDGANAQIELMVLRVAEKLGGQERIDEIADWAIENLPQSEVDAYNEMIDSGDVDKMVTAYTSIEARMQGKSQKRFISPEQGTSRENSGFESKAEMIAAMNDPRYAKDPAYRSQVERRLARTKNL